MSINKKILKNNRKVKFFKIIGLLIVIFITWTIFLRPSFSISSSKLIENANDYYNKGLFEESAKAWTELAQYFHNQGDNLNEAVALSNLSLNQQRLGYWQKAQDNINTSLNILDSLPKTSNQKHTLALALNINGHLKLEIGQAENAIDIWQKSAEISKEINDLELTKEIEINKSQALQELGLYLRSCNILLKVLDVNSADCQVSEGALGALKVARSPHLDVLALTSLGNVLHINGQIDQSKSVLLTGLNLAKSLGNGQNIANIYLSLGNTLHALANRESKYRDEQDIQDFSPALCAVDSSKDNIDIFYQRASDCYLQAASKGSVKTQIQAQLNLISLKLRIGQNQDIDNKLLENIQLLPASKSTITMQLKLAQNLLCLQNNSDQSYSYNLSPVLQSCLNKKQKVSSNQAIDILQTERIVNRALEQAQFIQDSHSEANALGYMAAVYQTEGKWSEARRYTELALNKALSFQSPEIAYLWQWQLARLYHLEGKNDQAIATYDLAFELLQSLRSDLISSNIDIQYNFRDNVEPVYREYVDLLLQNSSKTTNVENITQANLKKSRDIIEALQLAELNNFFRENCLSTRAKQIDQIDSQTAVIYSIILNNRIAVIVAVPGKPLSYYESTLTTKAEVDYTYHQLLRNFNPIVTNSGLLPNQKFYNWLIAPAEQKLVNYDIKNLVFVLDGILRSLPIAALHDGQKYLVEKYNLAITPGLYLFNENHQSFKDRRILIGGLTETRFNLPALPNVQQEVNNIAKISSTEIHLNQEFTSEKISKRIQSKHFEIVHLATHGQFSSKAEETFLVTWDKKINIKGLDKILGQESLDSIDLLILSACQTAAGDDRATLGLAGFAFKSGAKSTLATLFSIQDKSTALLISQFYKFLIEKNMSKAEALRQAQLSLLHSSNEYQNPYFWAPFVLVGNWL